MRGFVAWYLVGALSSAAGCGDDSTSQTDAGTDDAGDVDAGPDFPCDPNAPSGWAWMSGSSGVGARGVYGTRGVADPANVPGSRFKASGWVDVSGNLWLFGGEGFDSDPATPGPQVMNDLWRFDGSSWTWIAGGALALEPGVYGVQGVADPSSYPGARWGAYTWRDAGGALWLFGGLGLPDVYSTLGELSDLWRFDGTSWTWVAGPIGKHVPSAGALGTTDPANTPGARDSGIAWVDDAGHLQLFGGQGYASGPNDYGQLGDRWRFDGAAWTWVDGHANAGQAGTFGTLGIPSTSNHPSSTGFATAAVDAAGDAWLFGGFGRPEGAPGEMSALWRYDGTQWTWISGTTSTEEPPAHGTQGVPDVANAPGARSRSASWIDTDGNLWVFGGLGPNNGIRDDLWRFDGTSWTWMTGSATVDAPAVHGTRGAADPSNTPGARWGAVSWTDRCGNFWLFGGRGPDNTVMNDLWRYAP